MVFLVCKTPDLCANRRLVCRVCAKLCTTCAAFALCVLFVIVWFSARYAFVCSCVHSCAAIFTRVRARERRQKKGPTLTRQARLKSN